MIKQMKKITEYPLLIIIPILIFGMLFGYIFGRDVEFSDVENRYLTTCPRPAAGALADGSFMSTFETYTNEQIPFRNALIKAKAVMEMCLLKCENNDITKGKDGYLFTKVTAEDAQLSKNIQIIARFINDSGRNVAVAFAPTATQIYADKVPKGMPVLDEKSEQERLHAALAACPTAVAVDLFPIIESHKDEQLYYKTDHHWTTGTAYYAYEEICRAMNLEPVDITTLQASYAPDFYGTLFAKYKGVGVSPDTIEYYDVSVKNYETDKSTFNNLMDYSKLDIYDKYAMFLYGNYGKAIIDTDTDNHKDLIVFKDSYANCLIPFLTYNYDTITVIDLRYFGDSVSELLSANADADILMLHNYSFLNEDKHFFKLLK